MSHLWGEYAVRYANTNPIAGYMFNVVTDSLNYQKLGKITIVVSDNYTQPFWVKYPKKHRIRNKWIQRGYNIIDYAWAEYSMSGIWFIHPKIYEILKKRDDITDTGIQNFMRAFESLIRKRRVTRQELYNATHSPAFR